MDYMDEMVYFYETRLRNKTDLLSYLQAMYEQYEFENEGESLRKREVVKKLFDQMQTEIMETKIPTLENPLESYDISFRADGMVLEKSTTTEYQLIGNEYGIVIDGEERVRREAIIKVDCDYLSVREYAQICGVSEITVRSWIRRGKLRVVRKLGGEWFIPALYEKPDRGYEPATYRWEQLSKKMKEAYDFLPDAGAAGLLGDISKDGKFCVLVGDKVRDTLEYVTLDGNEFEQFELSLIAAPEITVDAPINLIQHVILKSDLEVPWLSRKPVEFDENECMSMTVEFGGLDWEEMANYLYPGESVSEEDVYWDNKREFYLNFRGTYADESEEIEGIYEDIAVLEGMLYLPEISERLKEDSDDCLKKELEHNLCLDFGVDDCDAEIVRRSFENSEAVLLIKKFVFTDEAKKEFAEKGEFMEERMLERILKEIPFLVKRRMNVMPHVLVHSLSGYQTEEERKKIRLAFSCSGFVEQEDTDFMYTYC